MFRIRKLTFQHLKIITVFSSLSIITGGNSKTTSSVDINFSVGDGVEFIKRIANGEKIAEHPGILMFTAPYKLCDGGCKGSQTNIAVGFPLYIGKRGREAYKKIYLEDFKKIHSENPQAPLKRKTTRAPFTRAICSIINLNVISTVPTTTVPPTSRCPLIIPGTCLKIKKPKQNKTQTNYNSKDTQGRLTLLTHAVENDSAIKALKHTTSGFEVSGGKTYYKNDNKKFSYDTETDNVVDKTMVTLKIEEPKSYNYENHIQVPDIKTTTAKGLHMEVPIKQVITDSVSDVQGPNVDIEDMHVPNILVPNVQAPDLQLSNTQVSNKHVPEVKDPIVQVQEMQYSNTQIQDMKLLDPQISPKQNPGMQVSNKQIPLEQVSGAQLADLPITHKQNPVVQLSDTPIPPEPLTDTHIPLKQVPDMLVSDIQIPPDQDMQLSVTQIPPEQVPDIQVSGTQIPPEQVLDMQISPEQIPDTQIPDMQVSKSHIPPEQVPNEQFVDTQNPLEQVPDMHVSDTQNPPEQVSDVQLSHIQKLNEPVLDVKSSNTQDPQQQLSTELVPDTQVPRLQIPRMKVSELRDRKNRSKIQDELFDKFVQYLRHHYG